MMYGLARRILFALDAERAHEVTLEGLRLLGRTGLGEGFSGIPDSWHAPVEVMGLRFPNAVGLAAGMDKAGTTVDGFGALGFGHVEVGTVTPRPQPGNAKPRLFRLPEHEAIINRMGFNNPGLDAVLANVRTRHFRGILGINLGKNFDTPNENALSDYRKGLRAVYGEADYIAVNLSSPNTKGLRDLQEIHACEDLLGALRADRDVLERETGKRRPLVVKLAPDLSEEQIVGLAGALNGLGIDGVIATNTTIDRASVQGHRFAGEVGGLSGAPLREVSLRHLEWWRRELDPGIPVISVGGILSGADARARFDAGAALVQVYTGLVYRGPRLVREILGEMKGETSRR